MKKMVALVVLDGWGIGDTTPSNPIYAAQPQTIAYIKNNFPSLSLQASGIAVGLPWGEEGNSEVGHLTMGIGKVVYQHYPRITLAIKDGTFQKNEAILSALAFAKKRGGKINFVGLLSDGNIHSSLEHLDTLFSMAKEAGVPFTLHAITDGRDSAPQSAWSILSRLPLDRVGSIFGRFYAMDRDRHWDLTHQAYQTCIGQGPSIERTALKEHIEKVYAKNLNDEYVTPATINNGELAIKENDAVFFFNFREDRMRQIVESFINPAFEQFPTQKFSSLFCASMTQIRGDFSIPVAFPPQKIDTCLGKILSEQGKTQLRLAETQKYAHVTFFFNGLVDKPFANEFRVLIPSRTVSRQDEDPEMMAPAITTRLIEALEQQTFDFILTNYANADMVAHTGNFDASKKAVEILDAQLAKVVQAALSVDATLIITADHGNVERVFNPLTGEIETKHDISPVPFYFVDKAFQKPQDPTRVQEHERLTDGMLADITPTILDIFGIPKEASMTGISLMEQLKI